LIGHYEKPFHPEIGGNIRKMLFEPLDGITANLIAKEIEDVITNFEPRVDLVSIEVNEDVDNNGYDVIVTFLLLNLENPIQTTIFLERIR
jgi:phage baseplate assembly protein W